MKKTILILIILLGFTNIALAECTDKDSAYKCKKMLIIDDEGNGRIDLNCTLPNPKISKLTIMAQNVLDGEGNLRTYWDGKTVCDVLGWMNDSVPYIDPNYTGLKTDFTQIMDLKINSLEENIGGATGKTGISFDSERPYLFSDDGTSNFHWLRMHTIVVHEFSHFIEKNSQAKTHSGIPKWVEEGRAKDFEDIVYDSQNPYSDISVSYAMYDKKIANVLNDGGLTKYDYPNFVFFKALRNKCGKIQMGLLTNEKPNLLLATKDCTGIPNVGGDELAGLFTLYNWAMLYKQDLSLLDSNEPKRPNDKIFDGEYKKIDEAGFTEPIDITNKIGTSLPPFSAKSFLITHETLAGGGDMNLTFKSNGLKLVAIRVGSSNVNDNFVMDSSRQEYKLTELDREGGLFVTLVNTTEAEIKIEELKIRNSQTVYLYTGRPSIDISSVRLYMSDGEKTVLVSNATNNGFSIYDGPIGYPPAGYDRYLDSKWAGTEYEGIFRDTVIAVLPFSDATGSWCNNNNGGNCNLSSNFMTYYTLTYNDYLEQIYRDNF